MVKSIKANLENQVELECNWNNATLRRVLLWDRQCGRTYGAEGPSTIGKGHDW